MTTIASLSGDRGRRRTGDRTGFCGLCLLASLALGIAGCHTSPLRDRFDSVGKEISAAKAAGAPRYAPVDYAGAETALSLAKESEDAAIEARESAEQARAVAAEELAEIQKRVADREGALEEAEKRRAGADVHLASLRRREAEFRAKGATDREIDRAFGDPIALAQLEASAARASIKTIRAELELLAVRKQECQARIASATEGIAVAGQQLIHASTLCDKAGASARMAGAHAIARRKAELEVR